MIDPTPQQLRALAEDAMHLANEQVEVSDDQRCMRFRFALLAAADELEAVQTLQTVVIDDPVAGRIEQRLRRRVSAVDTLPLQQMERFASIAKQFPPSAALVKAWNEGWQSGWANRHKAVPDADGRVGLSEQIKNPYTAGTAPQGDRDE